MQCKCGAETKNSTHEVNTAAKATDWCKGYTPMYLPVVVDQDKCPGCGRIAYKVLERSKVIYEQ